MKQLEGLTVIDLQDIQAWLENKLDLLVSELADAKPDPDLAIYYQGGIQRYVKDVRAIKALIKTLTEKWEE